MLNKLFPATVAKWQRLRAAETKDTGSIPAAVAAFQMKAKSKNAYV